MQISDFHQTWDKTLFFGFELLVTNYFTGINVSYKNINK